MPLIVAALFNPLMTAVSPTGAAGLGTMARPSHPATATSERGTQMVCPLWESLRGKNGAINTVVGIGEEAALQSRQTHGGWG